jgi:hypothetical protein
MNINEIIDEVKFEVDDVVVEFDDELLDDIAVESDFVDVVVVVVVVIVVFAAVDVV